MTLTDELKILDDKIKANEAQYELGREAAEISDLSSKDLLEKYKHLSVELLDKTDKKLTPNGETKKDEESKLTALPKWLHSKNDIKKAIKLNEDTWADTNNVKSSSGDKKVFNNLD